MGRFTVNGGKGLFGGVRVSGSKNAALPIIFASISTRGVSRIYNLPDITDVADAIGIIEELGAKVWREGGVTFIDTRELSYTVPDLDKVQRIRASTYLIGSCLSRFGRAELLPFGGCAFSPRPIDMHLDAAKKLGARVTDKKITAERLGGAEIVFRQPSVGATVNSLILAASASGETKLIGAAREPHIKALISYLVGAGAEISVKGDTVTVRGAELHGSSAVIPGDMIEAGTFLAASLVTGGRVRVSGFDTRELAAFTAPLLSAGVIEDVSGGSIMLVGKPRREISIATGAYPGFATDLQPIFSAILATARGGRIEERVWRSRFAYLDELAKLGLSYRREGDVATVFPSEILSAKVRARDLRGGAAAVVLALAAEGESVIECGELILRGYDSFKEKLTSLGAEIEYSS
jgi:UDP-N-acetylglucosamine 1-carboxyvinyltransferase